MNIVTQTRCKVLEGSMKVNGKSRYTFLFSDLLLFCRLPSKYDPEKLYKAVQRINLVDCSIAELPDSSEEGRHRLELQVQPNKVYVIKLRKKDRKASWLKTLIDQGLETRSAVSKPAPSTPENKSITTISKNTRRKSTSRSTLASSKREVAEQEEEAVKILLAKLERELREETEARVIAEKHNEAMKGLVEDQKKSDSDNLMDVASFKEAENRLESLSTLVDKLTEENITLTTQEKSKRAELISLRKANGKSVDDIEDVDNSDEESDDE